jgi:hypothetical protein
MTRAYDAPTGGGAVIARNIYGGDCNPEQWPPGRDLLTGAEHDATLTLGPLEVAVLREAGKESEA